MDAEILVVLKEIKQLLQDRFDYDALVVKELQASLVAITERLQVINNNMINAGMSG